MSTRYIDMYTIHTVFGHEDVDDYRKITKSQLDKLVSLNRESTFGGWRPGDEISMFSRGACGDQTEEILDDSNREVSSSMMNSAESEYYEKGGEVERWGIAYQSATSLTVPIWTEDGSRYTRAFRYAVWIYTLLRDFACLDESDWSEREVNAQMENWSNEFDYVIKELDDGEDVRAYVESGEISQELEDMRCEAAFEFISELFVSEDDVKKFTLAARDEMYTKRGQEFLAAQIDGQIQMDVEVE